MFKDILNYNTKKNLNLARSCLKNIINNSSSMIVTLPKFNFSNNAKRIIDLERNEKIPDVLKHKKFVIFLKLFFFFKLDHQTHWSHSI